MGALDYIIKHLELDCTSEELYNSSPKGELWHIFAMKREADRIKQLKDEHGCSSLQELEEGGFL